MREASAGALLRVRNVSLGVLFHKPFPKLLRKATGGKAKDKNIRMRSSLNSHLLY